MFKKVIESTLYQAISFIVTILGIYGIIKYIYTYFNTIKTETMQAITTSQMELYIISFIVGVIMLSLRYCPKLFVYYKKKKLKDKARQLSRELLEYVENTKNKSLSDATIKKTALHQYSTKYATRVLLICDELRRLESTDPKLDRIYKSPKSIEEVQIIGERLGVIAEKPS